MDSHIPTPSFDKGKVPKEVRKLSFLNLKLDIVLNYKVSIKVSSPQCVKMEMFGLSN